MSREPTETSDATSTHTSTSPRRYVLETSEQRQEHPDRPPMFQVAPWFLTTNVITAEELNVRLLKIHTYKPSYVLVDVGLQTREVVPYKVHDSLFENLRNTVNACISSSNISESSVVIRCPINYGHFFLDAVVELLAKNLRADIVRIDGQDLADLGETNESLNLRTTLNSLPYLYHPIKSSTTEPDPYEELSYRDQRDCDRNLEELLQAILNTGLLKGSHTPDHEEHPEDSCSAMKRKLLLHVRDFQEMRSSSYGRKVLNNLREVVNQRRQNGLPTLILGNYCSVNVLADLQLSTNRINTGNTSEEGSLNDVQLVDITPPGSGNQRAVLSNDQPRWNMDINIRRLKHALRSRADGLYIAKVADHLKNWEFDESLENFRKFLEQLLWTRPQVEDIARSACGAVDGSIPLELIDISNALLVRNSSNDVNGLFAASFLGTGGSTAIQESSPDTSQFIIDERLERIQEDGTDIEKDLARGVVRKGAFNVRFSDVCIRQDIKDALSGLIQLSIRRPHAYTYGVLKGNRIPGVLLYGPPGTGKTYFAKAVATESDCTTLEVSGAQVLQRYVGESEKIIQVIFQLARALQPCVVFLDEADSVFTRRSDKANSWERTMVNQFLHEWDIMASSAQSAFIIVATNRPQDIDDAILRRLPRRFYIGLPNIRERCSILEHYLADERHPGVDLEEIAIRTKGYSGSDLKNLCIQAASAAVEEEMSRPSTMEPGAPRSMRILKGEHFVKAIQAIRPCVTDVMLRDLHQFQMKYDVGVAPEVGTIEKALRRIQSRFLKVVAKPQAKE